MTTATATVTDINTAKKKTAIDAPRGTHFMIEADDLVIIGLDTKDGPEHPLYDERILLPLDENRVPNYAHYGVLKPVLVKKDGDRLIVVDGRQRVRYARAANKELAKRGDDLIRVPVLVKKGDDDELYGMGRAANLHTGDDPISAARQMQRFIDRGHDHTEAARTFGVSPSTVRNMVAMLNLAPEIQAEIQAKNIGTVAAVQLAALPQAEQVATYNEAKTEATANGEKKVSSDKLANKAREKAGKSATTTPKDRIAKAEGILRKLAKKWATEGTAKTDLEDVLDKLSKALLSTSLSKLIDEAGE